MQQNELPEGWVETSLLFAVGGDTNQIVGGPFGSNLKVDDYQQNGIPIIRLQNIGYREFIEKDIKFISLEKAEELKYHSFVKGDLVLAKLGTPIGKTCEIPDKYDWGIVVSDVVRIRIQNGIIEKKFLLHYLNSGMALSQLNKQVFGTTRPRVNLKEVRDLQVLLPPLPEQHRIVAAIEALFSRLDATNERLDRVPGIMKAFRQTVLATACDGRLTEDWREVNTEVDNKSELINALIQEKKIKCKNTVAIENQASCVDMPVSWLEVTLGDIATKITDGTHHSPPNGPEGDFKYITAKNIKNKGIDLSNLTFVSSEVHNEIYSRCNPEYGDLLLIKDGATTGIVTLNNLDEPFSMLSSVALLKFPSLISTKYIVYCIRSPHFQSIISEKMGGAAITRLTLQKIANMSFPLAPLSEQQEIVRRVDVLFAFADSIEAKVAVAREKTERLRQSILAKAFSGELVPTEAELARQEGREYESAEMLLERIQAEGKGSKK